MIALSFDTATGHCELVYEAGCLVDDGFDLESAIMISLLCDAPAQDGDTLPTGTPRRGWWADVFAEDGDVVGSRLWLLEQATATEETAQRARTYADEALKWLVDDGHVLAFEYETDVGDEAVELVVYPITAEGRGTPLGPFKVT